MKRTATAMAAAVLCVLLLWALRGGRSVPERGTEPRVAAAARETPDGATSARDEPAAAPWQTGGIVVRGNPVTGPSATVPAEPGAPDEPDRIEDEFVVFAPPDSDLADLARRLTEAGGAVLGRIAEWGALRVRMDPDAFRAFVDAYPDSADYVYNYRVSAPPYPRLPAASSHSAYDTFGTRALEWLGVPADNADWGRGVVVALLDTGVRPHPNLAAERVSRVNLVDADAASDAPAAATDYSGHATAVASLLAGQGAETPGIAPEVGLLSVQVLGADGAGDAFTVAQGILEAVRAGADIISLSLGTYGDSLVLRDAVQTALEAGVAVVAAAGNDGSGEVTFPARYPGVVGVGAVDPHEQRLDFSNSGDGVDLAAPGIGLHAAWPGEQIVSFSGTSAAVPFVTGALAVLFSRDPQMPAEEAVGILMDYANDTGAPGPDTEFGYGLLDISRVLQRTEGGVFDLALAANYLPITTAEGESVPLLVTVQNRGTEPATGAALTVSIDGTERQEVFRDIGVGQTVTAEFPISVEALRQKQTITVDSSVELLYVEDAKPANDARQNRVRYVEPPAPDRGE